MNFRVRLQGAFYVRELYDREGRHVTDIETATEVAEAQYGDEWCEVYNGSVGVHRDDWKAEQRQRDIARGTCTAGQPNNLSSFV